MIRSYNHTKTSIEQLKIERPDVRTWQIIPLPSQNVDFQYRAIEKAGITDAEVVYIIGLTAYIPQSFRPVPLTVG